MECPPIVSVNFTFLALSSLGAAKLPVTVLENVAFSAWTKLSK